MAGDINSGEYIFPPASLAMNLRELRAFLCGAQAITSGGMFPHPAMNIPADYMKALNQVINEKDREVIELANKNIRNKESLGVKSQHGSKVDN